MTFGEALQLIEKSLAEFHILPEQESIEFVLLVREALKRRVPKKPKCTYIDCCGDGDFEMEEWECPTCGDISCANDTYDEPYRPAHCTVCGQALDWTVEG